MIKFPISPQRVPGPKPGGSNNQLYDEISMEGGRTKLVGGGLIVAPGGTEVGEGGEGEGGRVKDLGKKLLKVMREKEKLSKSNTSLQKSVTELQKQVNSIINCGWDDFQLHIVLHRNVLNFSRDAMLRNDNQ